MTIKKGTIFGKVKYSGDYEWGCYQVTGRYPRIWINGVGHHAPTIEQLQEAGWMKLVGVEYDPLTHKLVTDSWSDDGIEIKQSVTKLTDDELANNLTVKFNMDMAELDAQMPKQTLDDIWLIITQQETHESLTAKYRTAVNDPVAKLPTDVWVQKKIDRRADN